MTELGWALLQPSSLLVGVIALALLTLWLRWTAVAASLLTLFLLTVAAVVVLPVGEWLAAPLEDHVERAPLPARVDGIVVLGGAVDWRVTAARQQLALNAAGERVAAAAALAQRYPDATLVFTGIFADAFANDFRRGRERRQPVLRRELRRSRSPLPGRGAQHLRRRVAGAAEVEPGAGETWLLVTSALHMPRALATFRTLGWTLIPVPRRLPHHRPAAPALQLGRRHHARRPRPGGARVGGARGLPAQRPDRD
jgi:uncharacterized SAM-binding protein YcdF (DUF218 family)